MGDEVKDIFRKVWTKLQGLPEAGSLDVGAFVVLLIFVGVSEPITEQDMAVESIVEKQKATGSPEDWVDWFLHRVHQEPWALGGIVVIGVFVLGTLALVIFALLYGCCRSSGDKTQKKKKNSKDRVI